VEIGGRMLRWGPQFKKRMKFDEIGDGGPNWDAEAAKKKSYINR